jgi:tripartite-type tricarboxylate transporter receptor subunit TctC
LFGVAFGPSSYGKSRRNGMTLPFAGLSRFACAAAVLAAASATGWPQAYPSRAIHFINPFPAGGPSDLLIRLHAQKLSQAWSQPAVVENRPGATGTIGTEAVVKAPPDGYLLLFTVDLPITMAPAMLKLRYDPQHDLMPIAAVAESENVLTANAAVGIRSLADLVAAAKARPGVLTFSSAGNASPAHLCGEVIKRQAGIDMIHVPYTGATPAMHAVVAGDVTTFCGPIQQALPHIKAGSVHALGVTGAKPSPLLPGVAPLADSYPGLVISNWFGLLAPAHTPSSVIDMLRDAFKKISADPDIESRLPPLGVMPAWISGADLAERIARDTRKWREFIAAANIKAERD